ncbi:hypothetical protein JCM12294_12810 [Desulfocicer niacini]
MSEIISINCPQKNNSGFFHFDKLRELVNRFTNFERKSAKKRGLSPFATFAYKKGAAPLTT